MDGGQFPASKQQAVRGGDMASGREKQRKFLQFVASVFIALNTITTLFLCGGVGEGLKCGAFGKLRRLDYSSVTVPMRRGTLVLTRVSRNCQERLFAPPC
jgi:hypothetical protein